MIDVERSTPPPAMRESERWSRELLERLQADFLGKCYLCESVVGPTFHVDHRIPKSVRPDLTDAWSNLFPACETCNTHRPKSLPEGGLASPGEGIERRIDQWIDDDCSPAFRAREAHDTAAANAARELEHIHRGTVPKLAALRHAIAHQLIRARRAEQRWRDAPDSERPRWEHELRHLLGRRAPFTMLLRAELRHLAHLFD